MSRNKPHTTILVEFHKVIDYQQYRLRDGRLELADEEGMEISQMKLRVDRMYQSLKTFEKKDPIRFFKFLPTISKELDAVGDSKSIEVRTLK